MSEAFLDAVGNNGDEMGFEFALARREICDETYWVTFGIPEGNFDTNRNWQFTVWSVSGFMHSVPTYTEDGDLASEDVDQDIIDACATGEDTTLRELYKVAELVLDYYQEKVEFYEEHGEEEEDCFED